MPAESPDKFERPILPGRGSGFPSLKSALDILMACVLMIFAAPVIGMLAILVKAASPGPALYSQTRLGLRGKPFQIWKLRTMFHNCEAVSGPVWSGVNDQRITRIGRVLRDMHLDELPQLWNVLRGEMSLVGPRPERPEIARRIEADLPGFGLRLLIKPGLTGLAQLRLPADVDIANIPHKLMQDIFYLNHQNLLFDLRILISTAFHFIGAGCACMSKILLAGAGPKVNAGSVNAAGMTREIEMPSAPYPINSIASPETELPIALTELSVAA